MSALYGHVITTDQQSSLDCNLMRKVCLEISRMVGNSFCYCAMEEDVGNCQPEWKTICFVNDQFVDNDGSLFLEGENLFNGHEFFNHLKHKIPTTQRHNSHFCPFERRVNSHLQGFSVCLLDGRAFLYCANKLTFEGWDYIDSSSMLDHTANDCQKIKKALEWCLMLDHELLVEERKTTTTTANLLTTTTTQNNYFYSHRSMYDLLKLHMEPIIDHFYGMNCGDFLEVSGGKNKRNDHKARQQRSLNIVKCFSQMGRLISTTLDTMANIECFLQFVEHEMNPSENIIPYHLDEISLLDLGEYMSDFLSLTDNNAINVGPDNHYFYDSSFDKIYPLSNLLIEEKWIRTLISSMVNIHRRVGEEELKKMDRIQFSRKKQEYTRLIMTTTMSDDCISPPPPIFKYGDVRLVIKSCPRYKYDRSVDSGGITSSRSISDDPEKMYDEQLLKQLGNICDISDTTKVESGYLSMVGLCIENCKRITNMLCGSIDYNPLMDTIQCELRVFEAFDQGLLLWFQSNFTLMQNSPSPSLSTNHHHRTLNLTWPRIIKVLVQIYNLRLTQLTTAENDSMMKIIFNIQEDDCAQQHLAKKKQHKKSSTTNRITINCITHQQQSCCCHICAKDDNDDDDDDGDDGGDDDGNYNICDQHGPSRLMRFLFTKTITNFHNKNTNLHHSSLSCSCHFNCKNMNKIVYFSDLSDNEAINERKKLLKTLCLNLFGKQCPFEFESVDNVSDCLGDPMINICFIDICESETQQKFFKIWKKSKKRPTKTIFIVDRLKKSANHMDDYNFLISYIEECRSDDGGGKSAISYTKHLSTDSIRLAMKKKTNNRGGEYTKKKKRRLKHHHHRRRTENFLDGRRRHNSVVNDNDEQKKKRHNSVENGDGDIVTVGETARKTARKRKNNLPKALRRKTTARPSRNPRVIHN